MVQTRLGLRPEGEDLEALREEILRYALLEEFRSDLQSEPPSSLDLVPRAPTRDERRRVKELLATLRREFGDFYQEVAQNMEDNFSFARRD